MSEFTPPIDATKEVRSPGRIAYGRGATAELTEFVTEQSADSVLLVTDPGVHDAGATDAVVEALEDARVDVSVFTGVRSEPKLSMPVEAAQHVCEAGHDLVVGCGGGSSMDTAKLAGVLADHPVPIEDVLGMDNVPGDGRPVALLPTTAGTGSEVTHIGVFADPDDGAKRVVYSPHLFADLAILDPDLTASMPPHVAAATGLDALTHAIESYVSMHRTPYTDTLARRAIELIGNNLRPVVHQGRRHHEARYRMLLGSMLAGQAFVNSGLGAVHALTYPIGIRFDLGHGEANAMLLAPVMRYNLPADRQRFAEIGRLLTGEDSGPEEAVDAVEHLTEEVGIPPGIGHLGPLDESDFASFADMAMTYSEHNIERNPRQLDRDDIIEIYWQAYEREE